MPFYQRRPGMFDFSRARFVHKSVIISRMMSTRIFLAYGSTVINVTAPGLWTLRVTRPLHKRCWTQLSSWIIKAASAPHAMQLKLHWMPNIRAALNHHRVPSCIPRDWRDVRLPTFPAGGNASKDTTRVLFGSFVRANVPVNQSDWSNSVQRRWTRSCPSRNGCRKPRTRRDHRDENIFAKFAERGKSKPES